MFLKPLAVSTQQLHVKIKILLNKYSLLHCKSVLAKKPVFKLDL